MGRPLTPPDIIDQINTLRAKVRALELISQDRSKDRTFIIGGAIDSTLYIPPVFIGVNPVAAVVATVDNHVHETKQLVCFHGIVHTGSVSLAWKLNGTYVLDSHLVSTTGSTGGTRADVLAYNTTLPLLAGENWLQVIVMSGTATDLSAGFTVINGR